MVFEIKSSKKPVFLHDVNEGYCQETKNLNGIDYGVYSDGEKKFIRVGKEFKEIKK